MSSAEITITGVESQIAANEAQIESLKEQNTRLKDGLKHLQQSQREIEKILNGRIAPIASSPSSDKRRGRPPKPKPEEVASSPPASQPATALDGGEDLLPQVSDADLPDMIRLALEEAGPSLKPSGIVRHLTGGMTSQTTEWRVKKAFHQIPELIRKRGGAVELGDSDEVDMGVLNESDDDGNEGGEDSGNGGEEAEAATEAPSSQGEVFEV